MSETSQTETDARRSQGRSWRDLAVLSQGFRPFFLLAGIWAVVAMNLWIHAFAGQLDTPAGFDPVTWHMHEMLFGYAAAVLAGFLLTAIPNWTGRLPLHGAPLAGLVALWILGRLAIGLSGLLGPVATAILDLSFLSALFLFVLREIVTGKNWRNLPLTAGLGILILANGMIHAGQAGWLSGADAYGSRLALSVFAALIALVGGRIVPSFTRNWLAKEKVADLPAPFGRFDKIALLAIVAALLAWTVDGNALSGILLLTAGALHAIRLSRWQGLRTVREPLLLVLHVGYAWLPVALALLGLKILWPDALPADIGIHALTTGAIATMTLAVMSRAIRGHTQRALTADFFTTLMFAIITLSALTRIAAPYLGDRYITGLTVSSALWDLAFLAFVALHARALVTARR